MNVLRKALANGKVRGTLVCLSDPCLCEIMGHAGYDLVWIDTEHTYLSHKEVLCHLNAARSAGIASLVRLPQHDPTATKQILEMGPDAVLFPMVRSAAEARELIASTLYPPIGNRGFGPMRAIRYGFDDAAEYARQTSLELCRLLQIESVTLIDELDEVAANPYVDGFIIGPNDLSGSVGEFLNVRGEATVAQIRRAIDIAHRHGKAIGLAVGADEESIRFWSQFDIEMLVCGADWNFVGAAAKTTFEQMARYYR